MPKSTKARPASKPRKPEKPHADFPLFPHATGRWAKKIRGKLHYFGKWDNTSGALERFNHEWPYLSEGRTPPPIDVGDSCTLASLSNAFLTSKKNKLDASELSPRSFQDYYQTCDRLVGHFGRDRRVDDFRPDDFECFRAVLAKQYGTVTLKNEVNRCRVVFKYAHDQRLIEHPVSYGQSFARPSAKAVRKSRNAAGPRMFEADELSQMLDALAGNTVTLDRIEEETGKPVEVTLKRDPIMRAMLLLAVNCGFGNTDVASLPQSAVDLESGWVDFPRPKTEVHRRCPLWPETVTALREAIEKRPDTASKADDGLCFLTVQGRPWVRVQASKKNPDKMTSLDALAQRFAKLLKSLDINGRRGFYATRHSFETIAGESKDQVAVNVIMGHVDTSMAATYRERISDERLLDVSNVVRAWLWPDTK